LDGLKLLLKETAPLDMIIIVGLPLLNNNKLYNVGAVIKEGKVLGFVPKTYLPNYSEFYEKRWFASSLDTFAKTVHFNNEDIPFGTDIIFKDENFKEITFALEICEDLWAVNPPSNKHSLNGANIIFNLSASNDLIGKKDYRHNLITMQSARLNAGYVYVSSSVGESSSDLVFGGDAVIAECGSILSKSERFKFESSLIISDIDTLKIANYKMRNMSFTNQNDGYLEVYFKLGNRNKELIRTYKQTPFVPTNDLERDKRCQEIFAIASAGLAKRLKSTNIKKCVLGLSGGLDSTLALLTTMEAYKKLNLDFKDIIAVTMPCFGTTSRTYQNAVKLAEKTGITLKDINIKEAVLRHFKDINQDENNYDITYENAQARERTQVLMDIANKENGLVIGTGDLSEMALGWCTYNGDHMSMYAVNISIPKTLVKYLVKYKADTDKDLSVLYDILDTPVSPELLPLDNKGEMKQKTEDSVGPYILNDFFLYHFFRYGMSVKKIFFIAQKTFVNDFSSEEIKKWLKLFIKRFFNAQFKRNCLPDGVKVGTISISPRGDLRMPSDASYESWNEL
jgi:NAD+ synthase (glutamine-hydrolysing)